MAMLDLTWAEVVREDLQKPRHVGMNDLERHVRYQLVVAVDSW